LNDVCHNHIITSMIIQLTGIVTLKELDNIGFKNYIYDYAIHSVLL